MSDEIPFWDRDCRIRYPDGHETDMSLNGSGYHAGDPFPGGYILERWDTSRRDAEGNIVVVVGHLKAQ